MVGVSSTDLVQTRSMAAKLSQSEPVTTVSQASVSSETDSFTLTSSISNDVLVDTTSINESCGSHSPVITPKPGVTSTPLEALTLPQLQSNRQHEQGISPITKVSAASHSHGIPQVSYSLARITHSPSNDYLNSTPTSTHDLNSFHATNPFYSSHVSATGQKPPDFCNSQSYFYPSSSYLSNLPTSPPSRVPPPPPPPPPLPSSSSLIPSTSMLLSTDEKLV